MGKKPNIKAIRDAQKLVKRFALQNAWEDIPNVDKFDHLHEELIEMSKLLRYKTERERVATIKERKGDFEDGIGDLFFGLCRLANQLDIDIEKAFNMVSSKIFKKYNGRKSEKKNNPPAKQVKA